METMKVDSGTQIMLKELRYHVHKSVNQYFGVNSYYRGKISHFGSQSKFLLHVIYNKDIF